MSQQELLKKIIQLLNDISIPYMITGSIASSLHGQPRSTHDIDLVISIQASMANEIFKAFSSEDFYVDKESIKNAINEKSMFNIIDMKEGGKVDFWILTDESFDQERFSRRYYEEVIGLKMSIITPEDCILSKLKWALDSGGSEKQFYDALNVYEIQYPKLDLKYIEYWVKELSIESLWNRLNKEAEVE